MPTGAAFIDLVKAFDLVDNYLLLDKLYAFGLSTDTLSFFNSSFQGSQSDFKIIEKGVPQGSSLDPLLFFIFINNLPQVCSDCQIYMQTIL